MCGVIVVDAGRSRSTCLRCDAYIHDHKPTIHRSQQTHSKRRLHRIDLHERGGEHCIAIQKERRSHLANKYGPEGLR